MKKQREYLPGNFNNHLVYEYLDDLFINWKDHCQAINFYHHLENIYPQDLQISLRLARHYKGVQDYSKSREYFTKVLEGGYKTIEAQEGIKSANFLIEQSLTKKFNQKREYVFLQEDNIENEVVLSGPDYLLLCAMSH